jgi:iron complex outermembrane receptor protein
VSGQFDGVNESSILAATSVERLVVPRWEHRLTFGFDRGPWAATLGQQLHSSYVDLHVNGLPDRRVATEIVWNTQVAYKGWSTPAVEATVVLGIDKLLDSDPPFTRRYPNGYDPTTGDPRGRFFHAALRLRGR